MTRLLLIEDQIKDLKNAAEAAESLGIENIEACNTVHKAISYLEDGLSGNGPLPDGIVLDLEKLPFQFFSSHCAPSEI
jgi:hypothetical protein